jgi:hypothetical protein
MAPEPLSALTCAEEQIALPDALRREMGDVEI